MPSTTARQARRRRRRLAALSGLLLIPASYLWARLLTGNPFDIFNITWPQIDLMILMPVLFFVSLIAVLLGTTMGAGRSPHVTYRPEQIDVTLDSVKGIDGVKDDVVRSLNLFLAHKAFANEMGGTPRRGLLFEGAPGTGKTHLAKAMAREAGVPFLFVSATSFQSMYYGATARKIRSYFKALRKAARQEGGAIGFIEEIDAIAAARSGVRSRMIGREGVERSTMSDIGRHGVAIVALNNVIVFPVPRSPICSRKGRAAPRPGRTPRGAPPR